MMGVPSFTSASVSISLCSVSLFKFPPLCKLEYGRLNDPNWLLLSPDDALYAMNGLR
jgi:hypothetical protein